REGDGGLVISGTAAFVKDQPGVGNLHDDRVALDQDLAIEERLVEIPRPVLVGTHEKDRENEPLLGRREVVWIHHLSPPLVLSRAALGLMAKLLTLGGTAGGRSGPAYAPPVTPRAR